MTEGLRLDHLIRRAVAEGVAPAIAFAVGRGDGVPHTWYGGRHWPAADAPATSVRTVFDLASLTKPLTTTLWCLRLVEAGELSLDWPIGRLVEVTDRALRNAPIWRLLSHTAGLPAHRAYYRGLGPSVLQTGRFGDARRAVRRMLLGTALECPPGQAEIYSDLGFLLLEMVCEVADRPLAAAWSSLPGHGSQALHFRPLPAEPAPCCAATERCPWRKRLLVGEVHDDNCWTMGGVGGHAGLFGTLEQVYALSRRFLGLVRGQDTGLGISPELARHAVARERMHPAGTRVLGWDTPTPGASTSGRCFGRRSIGHLGFTGTSVWMDPDADVVMVLLTNRVCPSRENPALRPLRPQLHDAAWSVAS